MLFNLFIFSNNKIFYDGYDFFFVFYFVKA